MIRIRSPRLLAAVSAALLVGPVQAEQPSTMMQRSRDLFAQGKAASHAAVEAGRRQAQSLAARLKSEATTTPTGLSFLRGADPRTWVSPAPDLELPERVVLLIHGLDEPGSIWDDLAPALAGAGYDVVRLNYPNDQPIAASADFLAESLRILRARGTQRVDLVCHSMGGLVARDALTRSSLYAGQSRHHADLPEIERLIMVATPHAGAPLAPLQAVADGREQLVRWAGSPDHDWRRLLAFLNDGRGQAADDLTPGSPFLSDLNSRPSPQGVAITSIAAELVADRSPPVQFAAASFAHLADSLGDGVVPLHSASAFTAGEVVQVRATHRGVLRITDTERRVRAAAGAAPRNAAAIPIILDRLARSAPPPPPPPPPPPAPPPLPAS